MASDRTEEQRSRILSHFDEQSRSLRRLTLFFLVPSLLFGLFVFLPFTQQVSSASRLEAELDATRARLSATTDSIPPIEAVDSLLGALALGPRLRADLDVRLELAAWLGRTGGVDPDTVALWAAGAADLDFTGVPGGAALVDGAGASACVWLDDRRWRECFDVTTGPMLCVGRGCLVYPNGTSFVRGGPAGPLDAALAEELVDSLRAVRRALVEDLPTLADAAATSSGDWGPGYDAARTASEGLGRRVAERRRAAHDAVREMEGDTTALATGLERARSLIRVIEQSGGGFTTPLGPLPVGIRELVLLYPAILGVAYLVCLVAFLRLVSLRRAFHTLTSGAGREDAAGPLSVRWTAPLWYEPLETSRWQLVRVLVALAPLAFMAWSYAALRMRLFELVADADARLGPIWYDAFFWLAMLAALVGFAHAARAVRAYRAEPPDPGSPGPAAGGGG